MVDSFLTDNLYLVGGIVDANVDPANLGDQYSLEIFQQLQLTGGLEITPSVQIIKNPVLNPPDDWSVFYGLRLRAAL